MLSWEQQKHHYHQFLVGLMDQPREEYPLMQFTGLKDAKGIDIYEGDILGRFTKGGKRKIYGAVEWIHEGGSIYDDEQRGYVASPVGFEMPEHYEKCEVVGNIYENPELLTNK